MHQLRLVFALLLLAVPTSGLAQEVSSPEAAGWPHQGHFQPVGSLDHGLEREIAGEADTPEVVTTGTISGQVSQARTMRPLASAQVVVEGMQLGAITDASGFYRIQNVPAGDVVVSVQLLGFSSASQTVAVQSGETATVDFQLSEQALDLDEIIVTGTAGAARRREIGNAITQVDVGQIAEPVVNFDQLLQSRAAGVNVTQTSASSGAGAQIRLRGNVSVAMGNQPLIYIDGVRARSDGYPINAPTTECECRSNNSTPSPLNDINPADIERIEIIKGPAATTLYGTEAAAGVIQVFTKRGAAGRAVWTAEVIQGVDWVQAFGTPSYPFVRLDPYLSNGWNQNYRLSVSGGSESVQYFLSGAFEDNTGVLPNDTEERFTLRGNVSFQPFDRLGLDWQTSFTTHDIVNTGAGTNSMGLTANAMRGPNNYIGTNAPEALDATLDYHVGAENDRFVTGVTANLTVSPDFFHRVTLGYDRATARQQQVKPFGFIQRPEGRVFDKRWEAVNVTLDYVGNVRFSLGDDLRSTFSWGGQSISSDEGFLEGYGRGFPGPGQHTVSGAANKVTFAEELRVINAGVFVQNLFDFRDRYFLTLGLRVDGNSAFGEDLGLQPYPKASFSYVLSEEAFWPQGWGEVKLRAAHGWAGRAPGAFDAVRTWQPVGLGPSPAFLPLNVGNSDLGPERTEEFEVGFDASLAEGRVAVEFTYYNQDTEDALMNVTQVPSLGFPGSQLKNVGRIKNTGIELGIEATAWEGARSAGGIGLSVATNQSEVTDLGGAASFSLGRHGWIVEGQPVPVMQGTRILNPNELAEPQQDRDYNFGPNLPTHILGGSLWAELPGGLRLTARGEYQGGHYMYDHAGRSHGLVGGWVWCEEGAYAALEAGQRESLTAEERAFCDLSVARSDMWIYPADHFKLRSVTLNVPLGQRLPGASSATFTVSGSNLWTWTNEDFLFMDPELVGDAGLFQQVRFLSENVPPPARISFAIRATF